MLYRNTIGALSLAILLCAPLASAFAFDDSKYPDFNGQWTRPPGIGNQFDISKPKDRGQQVPLTPEFQAVFEAGLADQAAGGQGNDPTYTCIPDGMPRVMNVIFPMEIIVTPKTTYMLIEYLTQLRRIAKPHGLENMPEELSQPEYATAVGLLLYGAHTRRAVAQRPVTLVAKLKSMFVGQ